MWVKGEMHMRSRVEIKAMAREQLGNNLFGSLWLTSVLILFIYGAITGAAGAIFAGVATIVIGGPMEYGLRKVFLARTRGEGKYTIEYLFHGFTDDFGGTLVLGLLMSIFVALWSLLLVVPGIVKAYGYSMAYYIKMDHPEYGWRDCLKASQRLMDGHKMDLFVQHLSFLGWAILGSLCLGVGALWSFAYLQAADATFYDELIRCDGAYVFEEQPRHNGPEF